jgi:hydrophobe/amphiphile efflux-3 (HAE3) family protein
MPLNSHLARPRIRPVERWVNFVVRHRVIVLVLTIACIALAATFASHLHKDTSANAYIEPNNPALLYRERVIESFGLKEPIVIVVRNAGEEGILNRDGLELVRAIVRQLESTPNIDADRIVSLLSQSGIRGGSEGLEIGPLLSQEEIDTAVISRLRALFDDSTLYDGTLISKDRTATVIVAELLDESKGAEAYRTVQSLTQTISKQEDTEIFVAGAGAITGYFSSYIDRDAGRLVPFAAIVITIVLFCAFLTVRAAAIPMFIAVATIVVTLGAMAASGVAFYAITNGMVVVLIGICVAEPMHVFGEYYALLRDRPDATNAELVVAALASVWRPIALTSITTLGGFISLWFTSTMPPIRYFGLFGSLGVLVAWVMTVTFLPALMSMLRKRPSRLMRHNEATYGILSRLGALVINYPRRVLLAATVMTGLALFAASHVHVDHARIENFNASEPLYIADQEINRTMAGTNQLDIVIEASADDGILRPDALERMEALQRFLEASPDVGGVTSIVDYIKELNRAMNANEVSAWRIPNQPDLIAQLMLTYQASASPTEFQSLIDSSGRSALIRAYLRADRWSEQRRVVAATQRYIDREFAGSDLKATLTGRVMLDYEWVQSVASGHVWSVFVSTITVLLMCIAIFRSIRDGLLCLAPLFVSVAGVYAVMGIADIWLGVATSMFASVAIGLGIDFAIHMVARARKAALLSASIDEQIMYVYRSTGRSVLFNATAVGLGFGVVTLSAAPPIRMFGVLVATAMIGAFLAALTVLPALLKILGERAAARQPSLPISPLGRTTLMVVLIATGLAALSPDASAAAASSEDALHIMTAVANRPEGMSVDRIAHIQLIDRHGAVRDQVARAVRKNVDDGRRMAIFYQAPANIRGTSFLVFDYADESRANDQWLYLPALRKVRRIPASDRGDYFLGTDLTFDEIRNDNRVTLTDWAFSTAGETQVDGERCVLIEGVATEERIARELGYSRARWCIDRIADMARRIEYWDRAGNELKTVTNRDIVRIDGVWTASRIEVANRKTGHRTLIEFRDAKFNSALADAMFTQQQMERGL